MYLLICGSCQRRVGRFIFGFTIHLIFNQVESLYNFGICEKWPFEMESQFWRICLRASAFPVGNPFVLFTCAKVFLLLVSRIKLHKVWKCTNLYSCFCFPLTVEFYVRLNSLVKNAHKNGVFLIKLMERIVYFQNL